MTAKEFATTLRKYLRQKKFTGSVRMARGTGYGWINIWGSGEFHNFTPKERKILINIGLQPGGNCCVISPDSREWVLKRISTCS